MMKVGAKLGVSTEGKAAEFCALRSKSTCFLACTQAPPAFSFSLQGPISSLGMYIDSGSIYEDTGETGELAEQGDLLLSFPTHGYPTMVPWLLARSSSKAEVLAFWARHLI